jgi:hypothetical protein
VNFIVVKKKAIIYIQSILQTMKLISALTCLTITEINNKRGKVTLVESGKEEKPYS